MDNSYLVLLPPILVLIVAVYSRSVILSLLTGIISSGLIATKFSLINTASLISRRLLEESNIANLYYGGSLDHLYTFGFLVTLGIIISLITHTGGMAAYSRALEPKLKNKKATESTSLLLSLTFFLDDYLSSLTVGSIMRPLTDHFKIPRAKLAFLLDSMSSPLCVLIPASSWVALIVTQLKNSGVSENPDTLIYAEPFQVYIYSILYMFYPILLIISAWFIVRKRISFGPMHYQEIEAQKTGNLFGGKEPLTLRISGSKHSGSILDFILPIAIFLISFMSFLLYSGNWIYFGGDKTALKAIQEGNAILALFIASLISLSLSVIYYSTQNKIRLKDLSQLTVDGFYLMKNSLIVLLLAWTLGSLLQKDLGTGTYLAQLLLKAMPALLLPLMIFITAILIAASTGSAWGTIAILTPLAIPSVVAFVQQAPPISLDQASLIYPVVAALISGSIAGGHISPISDSTIMSSTSSGTYHLDHIATQIWYVIPVIIGSCVGLLISGLGTNLNQLIILPIAFIISILITGSILYFRNKNNIL